MIKYNLIFLVILTLISGCSSKQLSKKETPFNYEISPGYQVKFKMLNSDINRGEIKLQAYITKQWMSGKAVESRSCTALGCITMTPNAINHYGYVSSEHHQENVPLQEIGQSLKLLVYYQNTKQLISYKYYLLDEESIKISIDRSLLQDFTNPIIVELSVKNGSSSYKNPSKSKWNHRHPNKTIHWGYTKLNPGSSNAVCVNCTGQSENFKG